MYQSLHDSTTDAHSDSGFDSCNQYLFNFEQNACEIDCVVRHINLPKKISAICTNPQSTIDDHSDRVLTRVIRI